MLTDELITDENFILFCAQKYDAKYFSSTEEFYNDLKRFRYLKKLLTRYENTNDLKERLILNHIIVINNVFGPKETPRLLYCKLKKQFHLVKPFLALLQILPEKLYNIHDEKIIDTNLIPMDQNIIEKLRKI